MQYDTYSKLKPFLTFSFVSIVVITLSPPNVLTQDINRPILKPCDSHIFVSQEYLTQQTSWFTLYTNLYTRCTGLLTTFKFYAKRTGHFKLGTFEKISKTEEIYQPRSLFSITIVRTGWQEIQTSGQISFANYTLGIWYDSLLTKGTNNPLRYADATDGLVHPDFLKDVWIMKMNTLLLDEYSPDGTLNMTKLESLGFGSHYKNARLPSIVAQTYPVDLDSIAYGVDYDEKEDGFLPTCAQPASVGQFCSANETQAETRWYYDQEAPKYGRCYSFTYMLCGGTKNNFISRTDCEKSCKGQLYYDRRGFPNDDMRFGGY